MSQLQNETIDARQRITESASRLGINLNEQELARWTKSVTEVKGDNDLTIDREMKIFGHKITLQDFDTQDIERFRSIGKIVEFYDIPGVVETALAISGSAAQSKFQTYPGDCDYLERVNIIAPTRAEVGKILAKLVRDKVLNTLTGENYQFLEVKFGGYPQNVVRDGRTYNAGASIQWLSADVANGKIEVSDLKGKPVTIHWDAVAQAADLSWCKLDWIVTDTVRGQLSNASNVVDITWEAPDGSITALDGYLDGHFQEVYLDAESAPIVAKLMQHASSDALETYVERLQGEIKKCLNADHLNYGKAAKRLYNIFRLNGQYEEAAFLRELFGQPAALLYQVHALVKTVQEARDRSDVFDLNSILNQTDELLISAVKVLEGEEEVEILRHLLRLYRSLCLQQPGMPISSQVDIAQAEVMKIVNNFFYDKMTEMPTIITYMENCKK